MDDKPWYSQGLRFQCTQCGDCCTGAPGFVWVNADEISALARRLAISEEEFTARYVRSIGVRKSLVEYDNGDCVFLKDRKCTVYEDRPRQCRTWPFWDCNLETPEDWQHTCEVCPGAGHGKLYTIEQITAQAGVIRM